MRFLSLLLVFVSILSFGQNHRPIESEKLYVSTDRYYFQPGEMLSYAVFLGSDYTKLTSSTKVKVWLETSNGQILDSAIVYVINNNMGGYFTLPKTGGIYYLKAISNYQLNYINRPTFKKELFVQSFVKKNFFVDIKLDKNSYTANQKIDASITLTAAGNAAVENIETTISLHSNDGEIESKKLNTSSSGEIETQFTLPAFTDPNQSYYITASCVYKGNIKSHSTKVPTLKKEVVAQVFYSHGVTDYLVNRENAGVIKTTDVSGFPLDIKGKIVDNQGLTVSEFETYAEGLAQFKFKPVTGFSYAAIINEDTIQLSPSRYTIGFSDASANQNLVLHVDGGHNQKLRWVVTHKSKVLHDETGTTFGAFKILNSPPGIISSVLLDGDEIVARRDYFFGWSNIKHASILTPDETMSPKQFDNLTIKTADQSKANFSIAIVEEANYKQVEDKSHSVLSWLYLGSEYATFIDKPQFYFDPENKKAEHSLHLLLNTLHNSNLRDPSSGLIRGRPNEEYTTHFEINGQVRPSNYYAQVQDPVDDLEISIKNTNLKTRTDSTGRFTIEVPSGLPDNVEIIVKKGMEKYVQKTQTGYHIVDRSTPFAVKRNIVQSSKEFPATNIYAVDQGLFLGTISNAEPLVYNTLVEAKSELGEVILRSGRVDGVDVAVERNYNSSYMASAPPIRNSNSLSSVVVRSINPTYGWYFGTDYNTHYAFYNSNHYKHPYYVTLNQGRTRSHSVGRPQYNYGSTLFWQPNNQTTDKGTVKVKRSINRKTGGYRILVEGIDENGNPVYGEKFIRIKDDIDVEAILPKQLYLGDKANIPVTLTNNTKKEQIVAVRFSGLLTTVDSVVLAPFETKNKSYSLNGLSETKLGALHLTINTKDFTFYERSLVNVTSYQIRETDHISGVETTSKKLNLANADISSLTAQFHIYPSFSEQLLEISQRLLRQPGGCFEQVSSSNYPNIMVLMLMKNSNSTNNALIRKAKDYLRQGYKRLAAYETPSNGFEWYGRNPPHQSLTAYGLLQFHLIREIGFTIDEQLFQRSLKWLWGQRDSKGGFKFKPGKYGFSGDKYSVNNAYITWVLSRVSNYNLKPQITALKKDIKSKFDSYKLALLVNTLYEIEDVEQADLYYNQLKNHLNQKQFEKLKAKESVMNSYGKSLDIEILALTLQAAVHANDLEFGGDLKAYILSSMNSRGYFGSTQGTALSLEALSRFGLIEAQKMKSEYTVKVNGVEVLQTNLKTDKQGHLTIDNKHFTQAINDIEVVTNGKSVPFEISLSWNENRKSVIHPDLYYDVSYQKQEVKPAESNILSVKIKNNKTSATGQIVATVNIPETYNINADELRNLTRNKVVDYYEIIDNQLNFYMLELGPEETKQFSLNLTANYSGSFHTAANEVFEYYHPETVSKVISPLTIVTD